MQDNFTTHYSDMLTGHYDCVDRIVLNAYFSMGHSPGGFRLWWTKLYGHDDNLDDTHLMRVAGHYSRRLHAFGADAYQSWFRDLKIQITEEGRGIIESPSVFWKNYILTHFQKEMELLNAKVI